MGQTANDPSAPRLGERVDILIAGARVYDGTGAPWYPADVAVAGGRIVAVGVGLAPPARRRIEARGLALAPGFIDGPTHADGIVTHPAAENFVRQGVPTVVSGNCGMSGFPVRQILDAVEQARPAVHYATLVGHGTLRRRAMGMAARRPDRRELRSMGRMAERAMREGALGLSTGLFYVPGAWAEPAELVEIARVVADGGGVYASHKRSAGGRVFEAVRETALIGRHARLPVQISHLKVLHRRGRTGPGRMAELIAEIRRWRDEGVDIAWDVHPYPPPVRVFPPS